MLHIFSKMMDLDALQQPLSIVKEQPNSAILLLQNAVYMLIKNSPCNKKFLDLSDKIKIYVLDDDLKARGIDTLISEYLEIISYKDFVMLTITHNQTISW